MSLQSDAAKAHIEKLFDVYCNHQCNSIMCVDTHCTRIVAEWKKEYRFAKPRRWAFDYAVPALKVAIEIDGGTFQSIRTGHASGVGLRGWRKKNNAAMSLGWRVFHYAPEEVIKAGRKGTTQERGRPHAWADCVTLPDEPILTKLPWL